MIKADIDEAKRLNLKRLMREQNIEPKILADMLGVSQPYISALLKGGKEGGRNIGKKTVQKICKALNVEEYEFYKLEVIGKSSKSNDSQGYTAREIQYLEDAVAANKKLNERLEQENKELNQKVEELENKVQLLKKRWTDGRRQEDPSELDVVALRKKER